MYGTVARPQDCRDSLMGELMGMQPGAVHGRPRAAIGALSAPLSSPPAVSTSTTSMLLRCATLTASKATLAGSFS